MIAWVEVFLGMLILFMSLGFLYRPSWVLQWNAWARGWIFNDSYVLHYRRPWGVIIFMTGTLLVYSGFSDMSRQRDHVSDHYSGVMSKAYGSFESGNLRGAIVRCQEILKQDADNPFAWALLALSWKAMGNSHQADNAFARFKSLDPSSSGQVIRRKSRPLKLLKKGG